jgi:hypothetical protein
MLFEIPFNSSGEKFNSILPLYRLCFASAMGVFTLMLCAQPPARQLKPSLPHYDWNICPGEGCLYGNWTVRGNVDVFDTYKGDHRKIGTLQSGDKVHGLTGVVITYEPGIIKMKSDGANGLTQGEEILTYAYLGEGNAVAWVKGRLISPFDISFTKFPDGSGCQGSACRADYITAGRRVWWAKIKMANGASGWVDMDSAKMDGVCAIGH